MLVDKVVDMDIEELDKEYDRHENLASESEKSSPERLSSSPEEFQKSFSPFSSERETPSPLPTELWVEDSPQNTDSSSSPCLYELTDNKKKIVQQAVKQSKDQRRLTKDHKKIVQQGIKQRRDQRKLTKGERQAREKGIDKFISNYQIIHMDNNELKEELKRLMSERGMTQEQYEICLDLRKKGKNKVAAQGSRAKKDEKLASLKTSVQHKEKELQKNIEAQKKLINEKSDWEDCLERLCAFVCISQNKDPTIWRVVLDQNSDNVELVLRNSRPTCL